MTGLFLVWVNTQPPNYGRDYLKQDMKAAGQSFTGLLSASYSTLFLSSDADSLGIGIILCKVAFKPGFLFGLLAGNRGVSTCRKIEFLQNFLEF